MIRFMLFPKFTVRRVTTFLVCIILLFFVMHIWIMMDVFKFVNSVSSLLSNVFGHTEKLKGMKYILVWKEYYLVITHAGRNIFDGLNCPQSNCIFTNDKNMLGDYRKFDAILFDEELQRKDIKPTKRSPSQLYVFTTIESSYTLPICEVYSENFFNLTFTYRLDSDVLWLYFVVKNISGDIIAPSTSVQWKTSVEPLKPEVRTILEGKKKIAAWLVSHCGSDGQRDVYLTRLQEHLSHYDLKIDVYGKCTNNLCTDYNCDEMIKKHYKFYMAFENSFAEDYVTEKVLHAYDNYAVPIVYGGANYSRFLPPGSYINAREVHPYNLAFLIYEAVRSPEIFESYFKWTNLYTITGKAKDYHPLCSFCEMMHSERAHHAPPKKNLRIWWNGQNGMKWCLPDGFWNESNKVNINANHIFKVY